VKLPQESLGLAKTGHFDPFEFHIQKQQQQQQQQSAAHAREVAYKA
jgi:hypothetical protein